MTYPKTKLVEEDNTIYEIDLECMRRKQEMQERQRRRYGKNQKISSSGEISEKDLEYKNGEIRWFSGVSIIPAQDFS